MPRRCPSLRFLVCNPRWPQPFAAPGSSRMLNQRRRPTAETTEPTAETAGAPAPPAPEFLGRAKDLATLQNAVVEAASVGTGLWISYLFVLFYLAIAVGSVTHNNLFFESPV